MLVSTNEHSILRNAEGASRKVETIHPAAFGHCLDKLDDIDLAFTPIEFQERIPIRMDEDEEVS